MSEKQRVPVFDPASKNLRKLPLNELTVSDFEQVEVPKWARQFDVYESDDLRSSHTVVTRPTDDTEGKSFLARLYISRLGVKSDVQRVLSSKYRVLYIGTMPKV